MHDTTFYSDERRGKFRFPLRREVRYKVTKDGAILDSGDGQTTNIGSGGVAFTVERDIEPGTLIQLSISWPVLLDKACPMRLVVFGRVLRAGSGACACTIDKYEFRTQSRILQPNGSRTDSMLERWAENVRREQIKSGALHA
jgi:hypothetical protein